MSHGRFATGRTVRIDHRHPAFHEEDNEGLFLQESAVIKDGDRYFAVGRQSKHSGRFHRLYVRRDEESESAAFVIEADQPPVVLYQPLAPGTTVADVEGATHALDDGTYWHFVHASPGEHYDMEAFAKALLISHFQPRINRAAHEAHAGLTVTARTRASARMGALNDFVDAATKVVETDFRKLTLGHHERETPQADNHRAIVVAAVRSVLAAWTGAKDVAATTKLGLVSADVNKLLANLTETPAVLTRAVAAHRAAEEAKKAEAGDSDDE